MGLTAISPFSYPAIMNGNEFYEVRLTVEKGRIVDVSCKNEEMLDTLLSYVDTEQALAISARLPLARITESSGTRKISCLE